MVAAGDGPAAVARLSSGGQMDLLISDLKMPKMTGIELLAEARRIRPDMPVVLMTAFATVATAVEAMKLGHTTTFKNLLTATKSSCSSTVLWNTPAWCVKIRRCGRWRSFPPPDP